MQTYDSQGALSTCDLLIVQECRNGLLSVDTDHY